MVLYFASSNDALERPEPRDKKIVPKTEGNTTTLGKTNPLAPRQYVEPAKVQKVAQEGQPPRIGMTTRAPLRFAESGQKVEPTPVTDWVNENIARPAAGIAAQGVGMVDPAALLSQGQYNIGGLVDPFYSYYQAGRKAFGLDFDPNRQAVSQALPQLQSQAPEAFKQAQEFLMYGGLGAGMAHPAATPEQFARYGMRPEFAPEAPRAAVTQTPMREILAGASNTPIVPQGEHIPGRTGAMREPGPGAPPAPRAYRDPGQVKALATDEMNRLERNAPSPRQLQASPKRQAQLETAMAEQAEASKYGRGFIGEKGGPDAKWLIERAKEYEHQGHSPFEIWQKTTGLTEGTTKGLIGAFKGKDGKWRVELEDGSLVVEPGHLSHGAVDRRYPGAIKSDNINLSAPEGEGLSRARHEGKGTTISLYTSPKRARESAAHEYQHGIQRQEGFARGGNWREFANDPRIEQEVQERFKQAKAKGVELSDEDLLSNLRTKAARRAYKNLEGEAEARLAGKRVDYDRARRVLEPPFLDYDVAEKDRIVKPQVELGESQSLTPGQKAKRAEAREQLAKETPELQEALTRAANIRDVQPVIDRLKSSTALTDNQRNYYDKLATYMLRPSHLTDAYYRLTNGDLSKTVRLEALYNEYLKTAKDVQKNRKTGTEFYVKDFNAMKRHLLTYGKRIGESFDEQPTLPAPWVVDEERGTVQLSPYYPDKVGAQALADSLPPEQGMRVAAKLPRPERMGPELTTGRQPREASHHREFNRLFTERFPTATRMMPGAPERGAKFPRPGAKKVRELTEAEQQQQSLDEHRWYAYTWKPIEERVRGIADKFASGEISEQEYDMGVTKAFLEFIEANKIAPEYYAEERGNFEDAAQEDVLRAIKQADKLRGYEVDDNLERRIFSLTAKTGRGARGPIQHHIEHPRGLRNEADPRTSAARKPGKYGPGDTGKGKIVQRTGVQAYPQQPKPRVLTEGPTLPSGAHEVKGARGGKIGPRDPARALKGTWTPTGNPVKDAWHSVQAILSPSTASEGARGAAQTMRAEIGEQKRHMAQQVQRLEKYRKTINALDPEAKKAIRDYLQGHDDVLPALNLLKAPWMSFVKAINETRKAMEKQISSLPDYQKMEFEENHLAQYWQESMRDQKKMAAKGHFMQKKYASYREGEAAGLHAKFDDPIQIVFQEMRDMANFLAKEHSLGALEKDNYAKRLGSKEREPVGTTLLQHVGKRRIYAAEDVARAWNNQWGPGVSENKDLGRLYMDAVRAMNASTAFTLGLSTKHAFNIAYGAIELNMQSAVKAAAAGRPITAAKHLAGAPAAPYSLFRKGSALHDVFTGAAAPKDERMARIASLLAQSNMNVTEFEPIYRSSGHMNWVEAYKVGLLGKEFATDIKGAANIRKPLTALGHTYNLVSKTMDSMMHPLFSYAIPRVKAGAFFMKMNDFTDSHPEATDWEKVQEAQRIADSIENVEGMMTQGNIMVAPLLKQSANLILQAPGWTFGALRAYGQGAADIVKGTAKLAMGKKVEALSENAAYTIAAALTTAGVCAFAQAIMGAGPPTSPIDLVLPRTGGKNPDGSDERFAPFGNVKDLIGYYHDWKGELLNKVRGPWKAAYELITNHDWAKHVVADPMDPWQKQVKDAVGNIVKNIGEPISIQQYGTSTPDSALPNAARAAGFTPAGQWATNPQRTKAFEHRTEVKEHRQRLRFERKQESQRAPVTNRLQFAKPEEAPRKRLRFAPQ